MSNERSPLLNSEGSPTNVPDYGYSADLNASSPHAEHVTVPPIGPDELPPPYSSSLYGNSYTVNCKVCGSMIDIAEKREQHVVKCSNCNEATPIRNAPPGKKYVRCPCHCLLICKSNSERIACPRNNCKRIIHLASVPVTPRSPCVPGMCTVSCAHCHARFLFNTLNNSLARCPHCRNVSSVGRHVARKRGFIWLSVGIIFTIAAIIVIAETYTKVKQHGALYVAFIGLPLLGVFCFYRSLCSFKLKVSIIEGPA